MLLSKRKLSSTQVTMVALDAAGNQLECISAATGLETSHQYSSTILYHNNSPHWAERIKVRKPPTSTALPQQLSALGRAYQGMLIVNSPPTHTTHQRWLKVTAR